MRQFIFECLCGFMVFYLIYWIGKFLWDWMVEEIKRKNEQGG